ncbi:MAG: T9SS type A sorting domain-containing protein [Flavobacteriales bacterium]|nr:T9SS type A sorting domain-containing protein [Flavobacteriales bacterium]
MNGELEWHYEYLSGLDSYDEFFFDIANTPDGGYVMTGTVELFPTLSQRHWMVKIDSCGYEQPGFCFPDAVVERENLEVKLWPNPTHHVLKAQLPVSAESVELYNAAGRLIFSEKVYHKSQQWNIRDLEYGVYFLRVLMEDGSVVTERVVKV